MACNLFGLVYSYSVPVMVVSFWVECYFSLGKLHAVSNYELQVQRF